MQKASLLSTVAAALLISTGAASAQSNPPPERAPAAQQKAPAERVAPPMNAGQPKGPETTGQAPKALEPGRGQSADTGNGMKPGAAGAGKTQLKDGGAAGKADVKSSSDSKAKADMKTGSSDSKSTDRKSSDADSQRLKSKDTAAGNDRGDDKTKSSQSSTSERSTTGQGAAAGAAKLSTEQRTKITTVIKSQKVERVEPSKLNISISIGTRVPSHVRFHPLPTEVIAIYPEWRGYDFILVGNQIIIIAPSTHEIVAILAA